MTTSSPILVHLRSLSADLRHLSTTAPGQIQRLTGPQLAEVEAHIADIQTHTAILITAIALGIHASAIAEESPHPRFL